MDNTIHDLFEDLKKTPFPRLGKTIGDIALFETLIAGSASSFLKGYPVDPESLAVLDAESEQIFEAFKKKESLDRDEGEFVSYVQKLNALRNEIAKALKARK